MMENVQEVALRIWNLLTTIFKFMKDYQMEGCVVITCKDTGAQGGWSRL